MIEKNIYYAKILKIALYKIKIEFIYLFLNFIKKRFLLVSKQKILKVKYNFNFSKN